ncbi:MAG: GTP cyclohydrolase III [Halobacteriales archaeon]
MANPQVTLIQIDNYGPWTVTPRPRREADLQTLQSRLFADLSQLFGDRGGYAFFARFDNMIAVSNGLDLDDHAHVQESIRNRYPVTLSLSVASGPTPAAALSTASRQLQDAGSAQDPARTEILRGEPIPEAQRRDDDVQIAHFDVNDATGQYTDELHAFETFIHIEAGYLALMRHLHEEHDALSFFVGGDNVITIGGALSRDDFEATIDHVESAAGVELKVGVGTGRTAERAGIAAKHALEACRKHGTRVEGDLPVVDAD